MVGSVISVYGYAYDTTNPYSPYVYVHVQYIYTSVSTIHREKEREQTQRVGDLRKRRSSWHFQEEDDAYLRPALSAIFMLYVWGSLFGVPCY